MEFDPVLVHDWLSQTARCLPEKTALIYKDQRLTYREIEEKSRNLASALVLMGLRRGERAVISLDNSPEAVIAIYAILKAGGVFIVLEGRSPWPVIESIIIDSGARFLITSLRRLSQNKDVGTLNGIKIIVTEASKSQVEASANYFSFIDLVEKKEPSAIFPRLLENDLACLIYTSGSTGKPKGIICTHHNMVTAARSIIQYLGNTSDDIILNVLPLSFDYGLYQVLMCFMFGGTICLESSFAFIQDILNTIAKEKVTGFPLLPSISAMLLKLKEFPSAQLKSLRYITNTGAAWPVSHIRQLRQLLPDVKIFSMYGLSECKRVSYLPPDLIDKYPDSVGIPMPNLEVAIVDKKGNPVPYGKPGQLLVRGPTVMQGYWGDRQLSRKYFRQGRYPEDRWLYTGDLFRQDENGLLYFLGRRDRQIKSYGHRINLAEVERVISGLDGIVEAAAVAVPDEIGGAVIGIFVVGSKGTKMDENLIRRHCQQNLEPYKMPRYIWLMDSLPRTPNGKINYKKLIEIVENEK